MKRCDAKQAAGLKERLRHRLQGPLPGVAAQLRLAPAGRSLAPEPGIIPRTAAVLIPLFLRAGVPHLLLTLRSAQLRHHRNEVSFPGGQSESTDASLADTALRELEEELGLPRISFEVLGGLTPLYVPPSRMLISPYVGWIEALPELHPNPQEVARVLEIPLPYLLQPEAVRWETVEAGGYGLSAPVYRYDGVVIWGATAMILGEFLALFDSGEDEA